MMTIFIFGWTLYSICFLFVKLIKAFEYMNELCVRVSDVRMSK